MLDFGKVFTTTKKSEGEVETSFDAVAVAKGADVEAAVKALTDAGFTIHNQVEAEDATLLMLSENVELGENHQTVRLGDQVAAVVALKGFEPFANVSEDFGENLRSQQFFSGFFGGMTALEDTVFKIAGEAESPEQMAAALGQAISDFGAFISNTAEALPSEVFRAELVLKNLPGVTGPGSPPAGGAAQDQEGGEEIAARPAVNKDEDAAAAAEGDEGTEVVEKTGGEPEAATSRTVRRRPRPARARTRAAKAGTTRSSRASRASSRRRSISATPRRTRRSRPWSRTSSSSASRS